eukprot:161893-Rhodomonas_salina.3
MASLPCCFAARNDETPFLKTPTLITVHCGRYNNVFSKPLNLYCISRCGTKKVTCLDKQKKFCVPELEGSPTMMRGLDASLKTSAAVVLAVAGA